VPRLLKEYRDIEKGFSTCTSSSTRNVDEPSPEESVKILKGIQKRYEDYHHVKYTDDAIEAAVKLSDRYIQDRFLPDKAIDLLDEAGSRKNLTINAVDPHTVDEKIQSAEKQKQAALRSEDYEKAAYYRDQVTKLEKAKNTDNVSSADTPQVTAKDMEQIVEEKTENSSWRITSQRTTATS
jgi:ATP-dependent Clp protease ATP-binding subunit ClpE